MIRFIKKWWFLENLRKEINRHSSFQSLENLSMMRHVLLSPYFFISNDPRKQHPEFPGLAYKAVRRFKWIMPWRFWYDEKKLKKRIQEYNDIFTVCTKEGYIEMIDTEEKNGTKIKMPSVATPMADKISGVFGLTQGILERYNSVWTIIFIPIITFLAGIFIHRLLKIWGNL